MLVVGILRFGEDVLLPIAFAGLLAFLLSPLVVRFTRWGLPKPAAIIVTVTLAFGVIGTIGWVVATQAIGLVRELPNYEQNLHRKITELKAPHGPAVLSRVGTMVDNIERDLRVSAPEHTPVATPRNPNEPKPVPVEVKSTDPSPWDVARNFVAPVLRPLGIAGIVIVFVVAMLFQREDLRDRVIKLVSAGQLNMATQALDDAASRVSRYLGMLLIVNATYGIPIGIGLYFIGIPNALLWGLLATLLRFIPFLGPWIAAAFPITLAFAVDPGWTKLLWVIGLYVTMEIVSNNIVEVIVYGKTTGISNLALLVAAVFWTWLWGPAGLVLSTPLTVCLLVLGKYVPGLDFLRMLLGSEPVLEPPAQFYQRMLSMESEDMLELSLRYVEQHSLEEFYDDVFLPALLLAEEDRHRGALPELREQFIFQASRDLIDDLDREQIAADAADSPTGGESKAEPASQPKPPRVLAVPARDSADEIVALMLCHLLRRRGVSSAAQAATAPLDTTLSVLDRQKVEVVVVSGLPPSTVSAARQVSRRVRDRFRALPIVVGIWRHDRTDAELNDRLRVGGTIEIVRTLDDAINAIERTLPAGAIQPKPIAAHPVDKSAEQHPPLATAAQL